jgi:hypothetical protein
VQALPVLAVSAATSANLNRLLAAVWEQLGLRDAGAQADMAVTSGAPQSS